MARRQKIREQPPPQSSQFDCVEIYLPKRLKHLSEVYSFLRDRVNSRLTDVELKGFSIYEVDGVFSGETLLGGAHARDQDPFSSSRELSSIDGPSGG